MTNEFKLNHDVARGAKATAALENEILKEAFSVLEATYIETWRTCGDSAARDKLWLAVNQIGKVREHLGNVAANGKLAQAELDAFTKRQNYSFA